MAEDFESRTEPATPRRREEARKQGQVAFSAELATGLVLLASVGLLALLGRGVGAGLMDGLRTDLPVRFPVELGPEEARVLLAHQFDRWLRLVGLFLGLLVAVSLAANVVQVGFRLTPDRLEVKLERLSPLEGFQRLFSMAALLRGLLGILKIGALTAAAWFLLHDRAGLVIGLSRGDPSYAAAQGWSLVIRLALAITAAMLVLGALDYIVQRVRFERSIRMTKQEVKEEQKLESGDPLIKARIRQIQREMARKRMMAAVPKAAVILTNPTHIAIALRYERGKAGAPRVVAKGAGVLAERIRQIAWENGIPILERPILARAIYKAVKISQEIPVALFQAVAEVLAFLYRVRTRA